MSALDDFTDDDLDAAAGGVIALIGMLKEAGIDAKKHPTMTERQWAGLQKLVFGNLGEEAAGGN